METTLDILGNFVRSGAMNELSITELRLFLVYLIHRNSESGLAWPGPDRVAEMIGLMPDLKPVKKDKTPHRVRNVYRARSRVRGLGLLTPAESEAGKITKWRLNGKVTTPGAVRQGLPPAQDNTIPPAQCASRTGNRREEGRGEGSGELASPTDPPSPSSSEGASPPRPPGPAAAGSRDPNKTIDPSNSNDGPRPVPPVTAAAGSTNPTGPTPTPTSSPGIPTLTIPAGLDRLDHHPHWRTISSTMPGQIVVLLAAKPVVSASMLKYAGGVDARLIRGSDLDSILSAQRGHKGDTYVSRANALDLRTILGPDYDPNEKYGGYLRDLAISRLATMPGMLTLVGVLDPDADDSQRRAFSQIISARIRAGLKTLIITRRDPANLLALVGDDEVDPARFDFYTTKMEK